MSSSSPPLSRRRLPAAAGAATAFGLLRFAPEAAATDGPGSHTASWSSVDQRPPAPGLAPGRRIRHPLPWGVFSVPAFGQPVSQGGT
ncbi:hypothetical protein PS467_00930 [Streptomyces luomodiensis]|uniref:Uncharacterized protein n=1 Tax=Streptomyces luomodiensis TaxID=3026192 RepID=A0ABY9UVQ4_9ACTN|nr:hypothetical protein [Streptomyces sp. SCA4-21]WNE93984.1 hypothetical protein PS467_00930 [Streptomyces sp. SCA4-21]